MGKLMTSKFSRRHFSTLLAGSAAAFFLPSTPAIEPFKRPGQPRLPLSLAAYSFRQYFKEATHDRDFVAPAAEQIDLFQFIDYAAEHGCDGVELTSYYFPRNPSENFLLKLKRHAFLRGIEISGTSVGNTFTHPKGEKRDREIAHVKNWIKHAALMGIPHIRVFAGAAPQGVAHAEAKRNCITALEECLEAAGQAGVFLGIENHGGIVAEPAELLDIIRTINNPWLGINLDSANFHTDDPYADFKSCAPYAVNVQVKTEMRAQNRSSEPSNLKRLVKILRDANYQGYVVLEYEAQESPYKAVPRVLAELRELL